MSDKFERVGRDEGLEQIGKVLKKAQIAMLVTTTPGGWSRSRPMGMPPRSFDGDLWFFSHASEPKAAELQRHPQVNVSVGNPGDNTYASLSGSATLVRDRAKMAELWQKPLEAWFPQGLDDPDLALIRVEVEHAEYWDQDSGLLAVAAGFVKTKVMGEESSAGYGVKVELGQGT